MSRRYPLSAPGLAGAQEYLSAALRDRGIILTDLEDVTRKILQTYFQGRREDDIMGRRWSANTWLLANMQVGESQKFSSRGGLKLIRQRMPFARKLMQVPSAVWRSETLPSGEIYVTRLEDGAKPYRDPLRNPKVVELVSLPVGQSKISSTIKATRGAGQLDCSARAQARHYLRNQTAQWACRQTAAGVMLTRIQ